VTGASINHIGVKVSAIPTGRVALTERLLVAMRSGEDTDPRESARGSVATPRSGAMIVMRIVLR
jgi:hypothetical protein